MKKIRKFLISSCIMVFAVVLSLLFSGKVFAQRVLMEIGGGSSASNSLVNEFASDYSRVEGYFSKTVEEKLNGYITEKYSTDFTDCYEQNPIYDDCIINVIPKNCFKYTGTYSTIGDEYGLYVETTKVNNNINKSTVFVFQTYINKVVVPEGYGKDYIWNRVEPIMCYDYLYFSKAQNYQYIHRSGRNRTIINCRAKDDMVTHYCTPKDCHTFVYNKDKGDYEILDKIGINSFNVYDTIKSIANGDEIYFYKADTVYKGKTPAPKLADYGGIAEAALDLTVDCIGEILDFVDPTPISDALGYGLDIASFCRDGYAYVNSIYNYANLVDYNFVSNDQEDKITTIDFSPSYQKQLESGGVIQDVFISNISESRFVYLDAQKKDGENQFLDSKVCFTYRDEVTKNYTSKSKITLGITNNATNSTYKLEKETSTPIFKGINTQNYKKELKVGTLYQAFDNVNVENLYKFEAPITGTYHFSSTDGFNKANVKIYNSTGAKISAGNIFVSKQMQKGEIVYISFLAKSIRSGSSFQVNVGMSENINVNRISIVGNANIGSQLPSDYSNTKYYSFRLKDSGTYRFYTTGNLDTIIYVYINGVLKYIEDDQLAYDEEYDDDLNAFFNESLNADNGRDEVVVVISGYSNGDTNVSFTTWTY